MCFKIYQYHMLETFSSAIKIEIFGILGYAHIFDPSTLRQENFKKYHWFSKTRDIPLSNDV